MTPLCTAVGMLQLVWELHIPRLIQLHPGLAEPLTTLLPGAGHKPLPAQGDALHLPCMGWVLWAGSGPGSWSGTALGPAAAGDSD